MLNVEIALLLIAIYAVGSAVQGVTGFGFALFSVPLVAVIYDAPTAVVMNTVVGLVNCVSKAWLLRRHIAYREVVSFTVIAAALVPVGVWGITVLPRSTTLAVMGAFVIFIGVTKLVSPDRTSALMRRRGALVLLGSTAGVLSGAFAAPGAAAVPYFVSRDDDALRAKANLQVFFTVVAVPVAIGHTIAGNVTGIDLARATLFIPVVFLVTAAATRWSMHINHDRLERIVSVALIVMGVRLVIPL